MTGRSEGVVYRILTHEEWEASRREGEIRPTERDTLDGYIHLSSESTLAETIQLHFKPEEPLVVVALSVGALGDSLRWEQVPSRGDAPFPHLHDDRIVMEAILQVMDRTAALEANSASKSMHDAEPGPSLETRLTPEGGCSTGSEEPLRTTTERSSAG